MWASIKETIKTVVYALLIAGVFRTFLFQPFWIPSGSMKETLLVGDFLFVNKMAYGYSYASCPSIIIPRIGINIDAEDICGVFKGGNDRLIGSEPERGDVVVFRHPVTGRDFIKRVIGLPGDTVQVRDGIIILNGAEVPQTEAGLFIEPYVQRGQPPNFPMCSNRTVPIGEDCIKQRLTETLPNGVAYSVLNVGAQRPLDSTGIFTVPEGQYFFMGDNRDNSSDSRLAQTARGVGFVPYEDIVGRADRVMFSSSGRSLLAFWTWRSDRYFKAIE